MRLAVVETEAYGGLLHYAAQLADALAERGHDVDLITARGNELQGRLSAARMRAVLARPPSVPREPPRGWRRTWRRAGIALRLVRSWARIARELRRCGYDAALLVDDPGISLVAAAQLLVTVIPGRSIVAAVCHEPRPRNRWEGDELFTSSRLLHALLGHLYRRLGLVFVHGERSPPPRLRRRP